MRSKYDGQIMHLLDENKKVRKKRSECRGKQVRTGIFSFRFYDYNECNIKNLQQKTTGREKKYGNSNSNGIEIKLCGCGM